MVILSIPMYLIRLQMPSDPFVQIVLPIPLLLVVGAAFLVLTPPPRPPETWDEVVGVQSKNLGHFMTAISQGDTV
jgi:hypothetical protein